MPRGVGWVVGGGLLALCAAIAGRAEAHCPANTPPVFAVLRSGCLAYVIEAAGEEEAVDLAARVLGAARTR